MRILVWCCKAQSKYKAIFVPKDIKGNNFYLFTFSQNKLSVKKYTAIITVNSLKIIQGVEALKGKIENREAALLENLIEKIQNTNLEPATCQEIVDSLRKVFSELADLREIGDYLYDGIYITDGKGKTLYVNKAYTRITGIRADEVVGKYVDDLLAEGVYVNAVTPEVIRCKKQVNAVGASLKNRTKMLITGIPVLDAKGNVKKVVTIDREITKLLQMKDELEASQKKMKAVEQDKVKRVLEVEHLRKLQLNSNMIGNSPETQKVMKLIRQVADLDVTVLITGETGSGKEVVSTEIYANSTRKKGPYIKVNCAAIPANLLEAELFGYAKGAFTGAISSGKIGLFELADKGTILLDEIGDMPMELQSKLLRVIQHKEITRIGGTKPITLDVRILAATNCDLKELVKQGRFREDLYYRLHVFPIHIPPLRSRTEDIETLARHFFEIYNSKYAKNTALDKTGYIMLQQYSWPGNIRELQNIIERLVIISEPNGTISNEQLGALLNINPAYVAELDAEVMGLKEIVNNIEKKTIAKALAQYGSTRKAAQILKVDQSTIVKKAKRLGIVLNDEKTHQF